MQQMIKDRYENWLKENSVPIDYCDFFGPIYQNKPDQFAFSPGDIKMIVQISEYIQLTVKKKGYTYFKAKINEYFNKDTGASNIQNDQDIKEKLHDELFNGVLDLLKPYGDNVASLFEKEMAVVSFENGKTKGGVRCVLCELKTNTNTMKRKKQQKFYSQFWKGQSWSLSNFTAHLTGLHSTQNKTPAQSVSGINMEDKSGIFDEKCDTKIDKSLVVELNSNDQNISDKSM